MELSERLEALKKYRDESRKPFIICLTNANAFGVDLSPTKYLGIFKEAQTIDDLQNMIVPALKPFPGKNELKILDFLGLDSLFANLDGKEASEEKSNVQTEVPSILPFFKNAHIAFRDKKDIEGVLGVDLLAEELAKIVKMMPAEQGSMIGIFGKWGRGKTFLMDQTWKKLEDKENNGKFIRVDFHAWKYQDTPATWAYLYECLSEKYLEPKSVCWLYKKLEKAFALLSLNLQREKYWPLFKLAAIIFIAIPSFGLVKELSARIGGDIQNTLNSLGITLISSASIVTIYNTFKKDWSSKAKDLFLKYGNKHSFKEHLGLQAEIQKETITLLKTWIPKKKIGKKKIVLFVEDIDRCAEEKIIQLIDSLRVLLEDNDIAERIIILTAVDEKILRHAIKTKYHALIDTNNNQSKVNTPSEKLINEYIDKLFIAGLKLGVLSTSDADEFLLALTKKDRKSKSITSLGQLIENEANEAYSRQSQVIQEGLLMHNLENAQNQDDYFDYEEPDLAPLYLESSELVQSEGDHLVKQNVTNEPVTLTFNLTDDEIDILRLAFTKYNRATPRQIKILYYRYLIAKNMLIRRYKRAGRTNVWQLHRNSKIMATLIIAYMMNEDQDLLHKHFAQVVHYGDDVRYNVNSYL